MVLVNSIGEGIAIRAARACIKRELFVGGEWFRRVVIEAARVLAMKTNTAQWAWEFHHSAKKDAPSGPLLH